MKWLQYKCNSGEEISKKLLKTFFSHDYYTLNLSEDATHAVNPYPVYI